jgi:hypothetical protein
MAAPDFVPIEEDVPPPAPAPAPRAYAPPAPAPRAYAPAPAPAPAPRLARGDLLEEDEVRSYGHNNRAFLKIKPGAYFVSYSGGSSWDKPLESATMGGASLEGGFNFAHSAAGSVYLSAELGAYAAGEEGGSVSSTWAVPFLANLGYEFGTGPVRFRLGLAAGVTFLGGKCDYYAYPYYLSGTWRQPVGTFGGDFSLSFKLAEHVFLGLDAKIMGNTAHEFVKGRSSYSSTAGMMNLSLGFRW